MLLPFALTIPAVTEKFSWKGDPIATTHSPTFKDLEFPSLTLGKSLASTLRRAKSALSSEPISSALNSLLSLRLTIISSAPSTTCLFVKT